jgi:subtilisin family serine protease
MRPLVVALLVLLLGPAAAPAANDPRRGEQWNLDLIESDAAHATSTGTGAVIAVVDTGVAAGHPDLAGQILPGHDFVQDDGTPQDGNGHGSHVSGIALAAEGNGVGISSVAPGARLLPVRVLADDGSGTSEDVAAGIDWARTNGAHVINLSLGSEIPIVGAAGGDEIDAAIRRALAAGVIVVAAAGNNGVPVCEQPAATEGLLCVGAVDKRKMRSFFSSFGQGLGVVAPGGSSVPVTGENILSTVPPDGYEEIAGTSQAAPHVAGVAALLVSRGVRGQAAVKRILDTATDLGPAGDDAQYGHGLVNARAALAGLGSGAGGGTGGGPSGGAGGGSGVKPFVRVKRRQHALRRGVRVRLRSAQAGRVRVRVRSHGRTIARKLRTVPAGRARTVVAKLNRRGRRMARRPGALRAKVRVRLPGETRDRVRRLRIVG